MLASAYPRPDVSLHTNVPLDFNQANYVSSVPVQTTVTQTRFSSGGDGLSGVEYVAGGSGQSYSLGGGGSTTYQSGGGSSSYSSGGSSSYSSGGGAALVGSSGVGGGANFVQTIDSSRYGLAQAQGSSFELLDAQTLATIQARFADNDRVAHIQTEYVTQAPIVSKHFYALAAPADDDIEAKQTIRLPAPQKQYKVIFIKAPSGPSLAAGALPPQVQVS